MGVNTRVSTVIPGVAGVVLTILARTTQELTGNTIAQLADTGASQTGTNKALKRLVASGLVLSRSAGSSLLYQLNRDHVAAPALLALVDLRQVLVDRIKALVAEWEHQPTAVALFGSVAREQDTDASDIDLLVVRSDATDAEDPVWSDQLMNLGESVGRWSGNSCEILEYSDSEFAELVRSQDSLVANLRQDAVGLVGLSPRELTRTGR